MINLQKILALPKPFWRGLSDSIKVWIRGDMERGYPQKYTAQMIPTKNGARQYSDAYKTLKANWMRRTTTGGTLKSFDPSGDYTGKRLYGKKTKVGKGKQGELISSYEGGYPISNHTASVNMMLSGFTIEGLDYESSTDNSLTMSYKEKDRDKIKANEDWGRNIRTLNDKNRDLVKDLMIAEYKKRQIEFIPKNITITVGKR